MNRQAFGHRYSRRDCLLAITACTWLATGIRLLIASQPGARFGPLQEGLLDALVTSRWSALPWLLCGAFALVVAAGGRPRRGPRLGAAWMALLVPASGWAGLYAWSAATWMFTSGFYGSPEAWPSSLHWLLTATGVVVLAGLSDPDRPDQQRGAK